MRPWPVLVLLLAGCAAPQLVVPVAATGAVGVLAVAVAVQIDADAALSTVKPVNETLCLIHPFNPASVEAEAAISAFCSHLPDSTIGLLTQLIAIVNAVDAAHATGGPK